MNASTTIAIIASVGFGVAIGSAFGLAVIGAGVGIAAGTLAAARGSPHGQSRRHEPKTSSTV